MGDSTGQNDNYRSARLSLQGIRYLARDFAQTLIHLAVLLAAAGKMWWINAWVLAGMSLVYQASSALILLKYNPGLVNRRGRVIQEDTKFFDKAFVVLYIPLSIAISLICGLDAVRFGWSSAPMWVVISGVLLYVCSCVLGTWAMAKNAHFEATVIIGEPGVHKVCSSGPYRFIRHPGYAAAVIGTVSYTLVLGSLWGLAASSVLIMVFIVRTFLEDRTLKEELSGYREYSESTRYRLLPYVW